MRPSAAMDRNPAVVYRTAAFEHLKVRPPAISAEMRTRLDVRERARFDAYPPALFGQFRHAICSEAGSFSLAVIDPDGWSRSSGSRSDILLVHRSSRRSMAGQSKQITV